MVIAIPVQPTMTTAKEPRFGVAFGVELDKLKATAGSIGHKRNVVVFRHRVFKEYVILILNLLNLRCMRIIHFFYFKRRQGNTTTGYDRLTCRLQHVTTYRADIKRCF